MYIPSQTKRRPVNHSPCNKQERLRSISKWQSTFQFIMNSLCTSFFFSYFIQLIATQLTEAKSSGKRTTIQKGKNHPTIHTIEIYQGWVLMLPYLVRFTMTIMKSTAVANANGSQLPFCVIGWSISKKEKRKK